MPYPKDAASLKRWEDGLTFSYNKDPTPWNRYDTAIQVTVDTYNRFPKGRAFHATLDWMLVKAILWVESGPLAPLDAWMNAPMQIGNPGDPGLQALLTSNHSKLIVPPEFSIVLASGHINRDGQKNIIAGTGYLLLRLAQFGLVDDPPALAIKAGNAVPLSPNATGILPGLPGIPVQRPWSLRHSHTPHHHNPPIIKRHLEVVGWRSTSFDTIAKLYNVGDLNYPDKLAFAYAMVQRLAAPPKEARP